VKSVGLERVEGSGQETEQMLTVRVLLNGGLALFVAIVAIVLELFGTARGSAACNGLSAGDGALLQAILAKLPAGIRQDVIVLRRNGSALAVVLNGTVQPCPAAPVVRMLSAQENRFANSSGQVFYVPGVAPKPPSHATPAPRTPPGGHPVLSQQEAVFAESTGAFHGIRTLNGWSGIKATVSIPCNVGKFALGPNGTDVETGYIYTGGWGAGDNGTAVDAGLQKSSLQNDRDDYAMYWKYDGDGPVTIDYINKNLRFPCGSDGVDLNLVPLSPTLLVFSASGYVLNHQHVTFTVAQITNAGDGWIPTGGTSDNGIILKRMITIAQNPKTVAQNRQNDSYFGIFSNGSSAPLIAWSSCFVGKAAAGSAAVSYVPWDPAKTWSGSGVVVNYPPGSVVVGKPSGSTCDKAAIDLARDPF
jgi:hypothetical protein